MTSSLTDLEKIRRLPWLMAADALNTAFFLLTITGPVFLLFLHQLGLAAAQIGFLLSLIPFCGIIAPFVAPAVAHYGYKRVYVTFWGIRKVVIALLLLTPAFVARFGPEWAFYWVTGSIFGFALCRAIAETGGYPWRKEAVPDSIRGKFSATNNMIGTVAGIVVLAGASYIIGAGAGMGRFMVVIAGGIVFGLVGVWAYSRVPGGAPVRSRPGEGSHMRDMQQALRDPDFIRFLAVLGLATLGDTALTSFVPLFAKEQIGLSDGNVVLLSIGTYGGALLSSYLWGWAADRYGSKPVMQVSLALMLLPPLAWFLAPQGSPFSPAASLTISFVAGVASLAWQIGWLRYLFVNVTPAEQKSAYMAIYYAWYGFVSGCGPLLAGQLLQFAAAIQGNVLVFDLNRYTPLFGLSFGLTLASLVIASRLRRGNATPFRRFAGMFLRGNPVYALGSLIQYNRSGSEMTRAAVTEQMGYARNPLSSRELVEALSDPSFSVRYEAVQSIGRMRAEPELVKALLTRLDGTEPELNAAAALSLGKLGSQRAIGPLRRALDSGCPSLEANSARALAMLGDEASIPQFMARLRSEINPSVRLAYAAALGRLRASEAAADIFALLRETRAEVLRGEIGLALARLAGDERYYMQHWRPLRTDPDTAIAQAVLALQKLAHPPIPDAYAVVAGRCADSFARGDAGQGAGLLAELICLVPTASLAPSLAFILQQCAAGLTEFGPTRIEYILLSLHSLDLALRDGGMEGGRMEDRG